MADFLGEFWLIATANEGKPDENVYAEQRQKLQRFCSVHSFAMPDLRVSAVDELLNLNDKLAKYDNFSRSVLLRLVRSYREYMGQEDAIPTVRDRQLYRYIPAFEWERGRFSLQSKLPALVDDIHERLVTTHDRLKVMTEKYKKVQQRLMADARASEGNLMVCDLQRFVKSTDWIDGEYLTTAMVVVPTNKQAEFEEHYWKLEQSDACEELWRRDMTAKQKMLESVEEDEDEVEKVNYRTMDMPEEDRAKYEVVAPNSAVKLEEQGEFTLYRVVLLKKGFEWFKKICREHRYNIRDFEYKSEETQAADADSIKKLEKEESDKKKRLVMFCNHAFPDSMEQWMHIKMIRVFVEAVLRFGPGEDSPTDNFCATILKVNPNAGVTLGNVLNNMYKHLQSQEMLEGGEEDGGVMGMGDMKPFVFVPLIANFD